MSRTKADQRSQNSKEEFRLRRGYSIGRADAADDRQFLEKCFVDTGIAHSMRDSSDPAFLMAGRTGAGKTALLLHLKDTLRRSVLLSSEQLSIAHVANTTILRHLREIGVNLTPFYRLLWRHILAEELLRMVAEGKPRYQGILDKFFDLKNLRGRKKKAAQYLQRWEHKFWDDTHERVAEVVNTVTQELRSQLGAQYQLISSSVDASEKIDERVRRELVSKAEKVISEEKIRELGGILEVLDELLADRMKQHYVLIDGLDEEWAQGSEKSHLILALVSTARELNSKVKNAKVIVAIRRDLLEKAFAEARGSAIQKEKFDSLTVKLSWRSNDLIDVLDRRINHLVRSKYSASLELSHRDLLPPTLDGKGIDELIEDMCSRPRDVIALFNECIEHGADRTKLGAKQVREALGAYSRGRLSALKDEWYDYAPCLEIWLELLKGKPESFKVASVDVNNFESVCLRVLGEASEVVSDPLRKIADSYSSERCDLDAARRDVFSFFYKFGVVGLKVDAASTFSWVDDVSRSVSNAEISQQTSVRVHASYRRALGIR